jgi:hypothetical protein
MESLEVALDATKVEVTDKDAQLAAKDSQIRELQSTVKTVTFGAHFIVMRRELID